MCLARPFLCPVFVLLTIERVTPLVLRTGRGQSQASNRTAKKACSLGALASHNQATIDPVREPKAIVIPKEASEVPSPKKARALQWNSGIPGTLVTTQQQVPYSLAHLENHLPTGTSTQKGLQSSLVFYVNGKEV